MLTQSMSLALLRPLTAFSEGNFALPFLLSQQARRMKQQSHGAEQPGLSDPTPAQACMLTLPAAL